MSQNLTLLLSAIFILLFTGCIDNNKKLDRRNEIDTTSIRYIQFDEHEYVMYGSLRRGGITHSPNCQFPNCTILNK